MAADIVARFKLEIVFFFIIVVVAIKVSCIQIYFAFLANSFDVDFILVVIKKHTNTNNKPGATLLYIYLLLNELQIVTLAHSFYLLVFLCSGMCVRVFL